MPDFLRSAFYPVLLFCLVGGLWMLGRATADRDYLPSEYAQPNPEFQRLVKQSAETARPAGSDEIATTDDRD